MVDGSLDKFHFQSLNRLVIALVGDSLCKVWWNSPNKAFDDRNPIDLMNEHEWERVKQYLFHHSYGDYS